MTKRIRRFSRIPEVGDTIQTIDDHIPERIGIVQDVLSTQFYCNDVDETKPGFWVFFKDNWVIYPSDVDYELEHEQ